MIGRANINTICTMEIPADGYGWGVVRSCPLDDIDDILNEWLGDLSGEVRHW